MGTPLGHELLAQVCDRADAILQIVLVEHFVKPDGHGLQIAARPGRRRWGSLR